MGFSPLGFYVIFRAPLFKLSSGGGNYDEVDITDLTHMNQIISSSFALDILYIVPCISYLNLFDFLATLIFRLGRGTKDSSYL